MARISRATQAIFSTTGLTPTGGFAAAANGTVTTEAGSSNSLSNIQTAQAGAWAGGFLSAVLGGSKFPAIEDMNAVLNVLSTQAAYLLQQGIPEYDAGTTYYAKNMVVKATTNQIYSSVTDSNLGNALTDAANWTLLVDLATIGAGNPNYNGGTSTHPVSVNAQICASVTPSGFTLTNGYTLTFIAGATNTNATTMNANATGVVDIYKNSGGGPIALTGGEIVSGNTVSITYSSTISKYVITNSGGLLASNNLSDVQSAATARTNLSVPPTTLTLTAAGLATGGGDLSANRTITVTAAVKSDQITATSTSLAVVPGVQQYHPSAGKAWVNFNGTTGAIRSSYNVASVTRNAPGDYTVNFTTAFADVNYAVSGQSGRQSSGDGLNDVSLSSYNFATGTCRVQFINGGNGGLYDNTSVTLMFMGNQ